MKNSHWSLNLSHMNWRKRMLEILVHQAFLPHFLAVYYSMASSNGCDTRPPFPLSSSSFVRTISPNELNNSRANQIIYSILGSGSIFQNLNNCTISFYTNDRLIYLFKFVIWMDSLKLINCLFKCSSHFSSIYFAVLDSNSRFKILNREIISLSEWSMPFICVRKYAKSKRKH